MIKNHVEKLCNFQQQFYPGEYLLLPIFREIVSDCDYMYWLPIVDLGGRGPIKSIPSYGWNILGLTGIGLDAIFNFLLFFWHLSPETIVKPTITYHWCLSIVKLSKTM